MSDILHEFTVGWIECGRKHQSILVQLLDHMSCLRAVSNEPGNGGKPKSRPPLDLGVLDLYIDCRAAVRNAESDFEDGYRILLDLRMKARRVLGYDVGVMCLPAVVCHMCGGPLVVARDASSAVMCAESCGVEYPTNTWLDLLAQKGA